MTYDAVGNLTEYDPPGLGVDETSYSYDTDHRLDLVTRPSGGTIDVAYDPNTGRLSSVTTSDSASIVPTYDGAGRISQLVGPYATVELDYTYAWIDSNEDATDLSWS